MTSWPSLQKLLSGASRVTEGSRQKEKLTFTPTSPSHTLSWWGGVTSVKQKSWTHQSPTLDGDNLETGR